jgi:hypothetical protein
MSKRYQTRVRNSAYPDIRDQKSDVRGRIWPNVKKVPNGRFQRLDPGAAFARGYGAKEITVSGCRFAKRKAVNDPAAAGVPNPVGSEMISHSLGQLGLKTDI